MKTEIILHVVVTVEDALPTAGQDFKQYIEGKMQDCGSPYDVNLISETPQTEYYQPEFGDDDTLITPDGVELWSYYVYANKENAQKDFPDRKILSFSGDDIENPYFIDGEKA